MKFCPKCEARLKLSNSESEFVCPKCGHSEKGSKATKQMKAEGGSTINVLDESEKKEALPVIKIDCAKCGNNEAVWWMLQTRSADEPTTQFYRCIKCSYTWRNYA
ncbi:MAG TPA: transcription factor S [Candidatus Nitrosotalea sp.]|nr:transcription factor S [Nitrososphaerota archaeon]HKU32307.1 transcription factor S [Candidatus Nitrosotalea sp.]